jgi:hypothetical protein
MGIKKYTNFEQVNLKTTNEGQFLQTEDFFIVTKNEIEESYFGECKYDVMEVAVYDVNNNLLPQKTGNNVAYIKSQNIAEYMYNITNQQGQKELAINAEKLLNDLGFTNGILKLNINFVRNKMGSENELERVWIQEISPSREEVRILPLKTKFENINQKTNKEFDNFNNLTKDFIFYKREILDSLDLYQSQYLEKIDTTLERKFGKDFFALLKKDFGLAKFSELRTKIFSDFRTSVSYYLENRYYTLGDGTYGKPSEVRFDNCERYDFNLILGDIESILVNCIAVNMSFLKRREIAIVRKEREFLKVDVKRDILDTLGLFNNPVKDVKVVFDEKKAIKVKALDIFGGLPGGLGGGVPVDKFDLPVEPDIPIKVNPIEIAVIPKPKPKLLLIEDTPPIFDFDLIPIDILPPPPKFDDISETIEPRGGYVVEPIKEVPPPPGGGVGGGVFINNDPSNFGNNDGSGTGNSNPRDIGVISYENME